jgi:GAF domain-containing protein
MQNAHQHPADGPPRTPLLEILRAHAGEIVEKWAAEAAKIPFTRAADFAVPLGARMDRMRAYLDALVERSENPDSKKAHEILRSTIRAEHLKSLNLSSVIRNQHILRDIMYGVVEKHFPASSRESAKTAIDAMIDRSVEEIVLLLEEFTETQAVLMRCLSCAPTQRQELEHILSQFCRNAMGYFDADFVALFRLHEDARELVCTSCCAKGAAISKDKRIMLESFPIAAEAIASRKTRMCVEGSKDQVPRKRILGQFAFEHCVAIPMLGSQKTLGVFFIADNSRLTPLTSEEAAMAEDLANHIVRVVENAELFDLLSIRSRAQKALIETAANLQKEIESEEIFRIVASKMSELIPNNELAFYMFDWEKRVGNPVYATGPYAGETMEDRNFPVEVGIVGHVARTKKAEIIVDTEADPRGNHIPGTPATHSRMLAVPIIGRKDVLGVIELLKYPPDVFSKDDLDVATLFANHAAVAIENARLLKEVVGAKEQNELHMDLLTHDIANYTTPVMAYLDALGGRKDLDPSVAQIMERTTQQIESIMRLVNMVRTMAKLRNGTPLLLRHMDLRKSVEQSVSQVSRELQGKKVEFEVRFPKESILVQADEMLPEIFTNLFLTAVRSDRRDSVTLVLSAESRREGRRDMWWVKVAQPERSIPDHLKTEVLRMAKASKSELAGGFGIGLATAKGIVERYLGQMWVSDMVKGDPAKGCVYNITLPKVP